MQLEIASVSQSCGAIKSGRSAAVNAGEKTGRRVYGLELSETFCDVIINRWQAFSGKAAILDGDGRSFDEVGRERVGSSRLLKGRAA
jgi:hypothetical protein